MLLKSIILIAVLFTVQIYSQDLTRSELDSLYTKFLQLRAPELLPETDLPQELTQVDRKCGFGIISQIRTNFDYFSSERQVILNSILQRKVKQKSMVSPSGFFRIHYDTTGSQTPMYDPTLTTEENVYKVALAADSVFRFEVNFLGFPEAPSDNGAGGDNLYDIYITSADGNYGFTDPEIPLGNDRFASYMEIHYDFQGSSFATHGLNAMRVTVAHEFHHAIQIGNYIYRDEDRFFYELTSTSMEEFVYDNVNDYYAYISNYMNNPSRNFFRFSSYLDGYDLAIWNIYLRDNFGYEIIREQWERMPTQRALYAISNTLVFRGTSFAKEYNRFGIWTYFTDVRAIPGLYFEEAEYYPLLTPLANISYPQYNYAQVEAYSTSNNFLKFINTTNSDTLFAIVSNGDVSSAITEPNQRYNFTYTLFSDTLSGTRKLANRYSADFSLSGSNVWSVSEILNDVVILADSIPGQIPEDISYAYPNPFNYKSNFLSTPLIFFPFDSELSEEVDFNVYSIDMQLIYNKTLNIQNLPGDQQGVSWDGKDEGGNILASGIYIYVIKKGDEIVTGKIVIFNE
jgi:hypothetical protein